MIFKEETAEELRKKTRDEIIADIRRDTLVLDLMFLEVKRDIEELLEKHKHKSNPNVHLQPRHPEGTSEGGQWMREGDGSTPISNSRTSRDSSTDKSPDIDAAIKHLREKAEPISKGECARYVRRAISAGGFDIKPSGDAKNYGKEMERIGFTPITIWDNQPNQSLSKDGYPKDYKPVAGDVVIIQPHVGGRTEGHMAMYDGSIWISDFKQRGIWPGAGYRLHKPNYVIYRY